jgi:hypothetical protein
VQSSIIFVYKNTEILEEHRLDKEVKDPLAMILKVMSSKNSASLLYSVVY